MSAHEYVAPTFSHWSTDPDSGVEDVSLCDQCGSLVAFFSRDVHTEWHRGVAQR